MKKSNEKIQWKNQFVNLIAIFVGVYIAFALNDWQLSKSKEANKVQYLLSLKEDLIRDKATLADGILELDTLIHKVGGLVQTKNFDTIDKDSLVYFLSGIQSQPTFYPANFTFQSMINTGDMGGLSDIVFRKDILELYNGQYLLIKELDEVSLKNFQDHVITVIIDKGSFDNNFLTSDSFKALCGVVLGFHNQRKRAYLKAIHQIDVILGEIENRKR